ncbi:phosphotriesterase family protein [Actinomadura madurae]|uniref:phosphotriesterase family protein n=1 Tax=Actinomadura madurae TaxID=1993 RepID=UPI000D8BDB64|nr:phosphotriesterase-related protein [Actinomadura madurae]SPT51473.1 Phosphotriesterase homology protein [Actinomadura madurae]
MASVMTVTGPVDASELGITLSHEHLLIDLTGYVERPAWASRAAFTDEKVQLHNLDRMRRNPYANLDNCLLGDIDTAVEEIQRFQRLGGRTVVDVTNADIGRDPLGLREIAFATGLNIIAGCGHYVHAAHPAELASRPADQIAGRMINDLTTGIDGTGVRAGIIGEIGTTDPLDPAERKVLEAAAKAHLETGAAISIHVHPPTRYAHDVLDVLESQGVSLRHVVLGHMDGTLAHTDIVLDEAVEHHASLAARGCYIEYDLCGNNGYFEHNGLAWWLPSDQQRAMALRRLIDRGHGDKLLLSHDVGHKHYLTKYGGWGYGHILQTMTKIMAACEITQQEMTAMMVDNPARMLTAAP